MKPHNDHDEIKALDVLAYTLGRITDPTRRVAIEATRRTRPELWEGLPNNEPPTDADETSFEQGAVEDCPPDALVTYFEKHNRFRTMIEDIADALEDCPPGPTLVVDKPILKGWDAERFGGQTVVFNAGSGFSDGSQSPLPAPPYVVARGEKLCIEQHENDVPYGVIRVVASTAGKPIASMVQVMRFDMVARFWKGTLRLDDLFPTGVPSGHIDFHVQPATLELFDWFPLAELEERGRDLLPHQVREKEAVAALIGKLKERKHGT